MKEKIILFEDKKDCCGCSACANICPKQAINMEKDEYGFTYPKIDENKCIKCGLCKKTCAYKKELLKNNNQTCYAGSTKEEKVLLKSSSGGIFTTIATEFIEDNGIVYGCALEKANDSLIPHHIRVEKKEDLKKLQGSKYVQSQMENIYKLIKNDLENNKKVLFSGTPCQVDALKVFLGKKYDTLFTIDIICHGVPSTALFQDYLKFMEKEIHGEIKDIIFRDKSEGWGINIGKITYIDKKGKEKYKFFKSHTSSYYNLFLTSKIYRENCYTCKYAGQNRISDMTIGDYWGIEKEHPEYIQENGGNLIPQKGVSCIIINSQKGKELLEKYNEKIELHKSSIEKIARENSQLNHPSLYSKEREIILEKYKTGGYKAVDKWFFDKKGIKKYLVYMYNKLPRSFQKLIKK